MAKYFQVYLLAFHILIAFQQTFALLAIPLEDLLGPNSCPSGSICKEKSACSMEYYLYTKAGAYFYCGPRQQIDSKICCKEVDSLEARASTNDIADQNELELEVDNFLRSSQVESTETSEGDDEVDILSLPFVTPEELQEISSDSAQGFPNDGVDLEGFSSEDSHNSLPVDTEYQELDNSVLSASPKTQETLVETTITDKATHVDEPSQESVNQFLSGSQSIPKQEADDLEGGNVQSRMIHNENYDNQRPKAFPCTCEKGERGDQGPKGEPGEPGKVIYIPVFVSNTPTGMPPSTSIGGIPAAPLYFGSSQANMNPSTPQQVPQHPNPTVIPFNVPITVPSNNPPVLNTPMASGPMTPPQQHQVPVPQVQHQYQLSQPSPPTPTTLYPYAIATNTDSLQARPSRQSYVNDPRLVIRRV